MKIKTVLVGFLILVNSVFMNAQTQTIPLWPGTIPHQIKGDIEEKGEYTDILRISRVQVPALEVYLPSKKNSNGKAVLIFPGGGYGILAYDWEGTDIAKWLNSKGIAGIVVKYRLPDATTQTDPKVTPLTDAQRAIRLVRSKAESWNIDPEQVGVIGFSAGGHLAATLSTQFDKKVYQPVDSTDQLNTRPDFAALIYPVITFVSPATHQGSRDNLLGKDAEEAVARSFSADLQIDENTPPTFLIHANDDEAVPVENSLMYAAALREHKVPCEIHIYPSGGHGFSLGFGKGTAESWPDLFFRWMQQF